MASLPVRKIAIAGVLSAVAIVLGVTRLGFIPWFSGASITIMHVPVIVGTLLEGPIVGTAIGIIFGVSSLLQAAIAPTGPVDVAFVNPLVSVLPRLLIAPASWLLYRLVLGNPGTVSALRESAALIAAGVIGSIANTVFVLSGLGILGFIPWNAVGAIAVANGVPEAIVAALVVFAVVSAWRSVPTGGGKAGISRDEGE